MGVWAVSIGLAGLTGVLAAPIIGLDPGDFTLLMVAAFAAVIAARLRSLPVAMAVGLFMGIAGNLVQYFFSNSSTLSADVIPAIPFIVTAIFLIYFMIRGTGVDESEGSGGPLDRAIMPQGEAPTGTNRERYASPFGWQLPLLAFAILCLLPLFLKGFWVGLIGQGICLGIIFLVLHPRHRRGRHDLAVPGDLRRHRGGGGGPARRPPRVAGPAGGGGRWADRRRRSVSSSAW